MFRIMLLPPEARQAVDISIAAQVHVSDQGVGGHFVSPKVNKKIFDTPPPLNPEPQSPNPNTQHPEF